MCVNKVINILAETFKLKDMEKKEYKRLLIDYINAFGYWSEEVFDLNNKCIDVFGYDEYLRLQNSVTGKIKVQVK